MPWAGVPFANLRATGEWVRSVSEITSCAHGSPAELEVCQHQDSSVSQGLGSSEQVPVLPRSASCLCGL